MGGLRCRQLRRHEAKLYERANASFEEPVVNLIHVRKIVDREALGVFRIYPVLVVKDSVKAHIPKTGDLPRRAKIAAITLTERQVRAPGSEYLFPEVRKGVAGAGCVNHNRLRKDGPPTRSTEDQDYQ